MALALPDTRELFDDVLDALRRRALRGCEFGFTEADVADLLGVCRETVSRWWSAYAREGLGAPARPHRATRRLGPNLSGPQAQQIQKQLTAHGPENLGIRAPLWTRRSVQQLIRNELGIVMPVRTVGLYLQRWGYTAKRSRRHAQKQDSEEIRPWWEETYPAIEQRAEEERAVIHWCNEIGVTAWMAAHRDRIELFYLPTYATEYLNNDLKGQVNVSGLPDNKGALRSRMQGFMNKLRWLPQHVRNYFKHPCAINNIVL